MLGNLFKKSEPVDPDPTPETLICMVLLRSAKGITPSRIAAAWRELFPDVPPLRSVATEQRTLEILALGCAIRMGAKPEQGPMEMIEMAADLSSGMWPEAVEMVRQHRVHLTLIALPSDSKEYPMGGQAMALTMVAAAVMKAGDPVAMMWGGAPLVHSPELMYQVMTETAPDNLGMASVLWLQRFAESEGPMGPWTFSTDGLSAFGQKDLEIVDARVSEEVLTEATYGILHYLLENGPVLRHGDTFGPNAKTKWKIEHTRSTKLKDQDDNPLPVLRVHVK
jgi:hypothetical protein